MIWRNTENFLSPVASHQWLLWRLLEAPILLDLPSDLAAYSRKITSVMSQAGTELPQSQFDTNISRLSDGVVGWNIPLPASLEESPCCSNRNVVIVVLDGCIAYKTLDGRLLSKGGRRQLDLRGACGAIRP